MWQVINAFYPSYGVIIPIYSGFKPNFKKWVTNDSTLYASYLFKKDVPDADISSLLIEW